jgi:hypothetical protein
MDSPGWYQFLHDEYFVWKYTARNRYASTTRQLRRYVDDNALDELDAIRRKLLALDTDDIRSILARLLCAKSGHATTGAEDAVLSSSQLSSSQIARRCFRVRQLRSANFLKVRSETAEA